jgi:hypothetical protein
MTTSADTHVPGYLGRILESPGNPVGTCFQVKPGILVTAWHVLAECAAGQVGKSILVDSLAPGRSSPTQARVERVDREHDLAVLRIATPLEASVEYYEPSEVQPAETKVVITGHSVVPDYKGQGPAFGSKRFLDAPGAWAGGTVIDDRVALGRVNASDVVLGMSGAPVRRLSDDAVIGVVCARYNSGSTRLRDTVWVTRTEDLQSLLVGLADIELTSRALLRILELIRAREDLYTYVKRQETRRERTGHSTTVPIPEAYLELRKIYYDLDILSGPDGPFPVAIFPLTPRAESDPETISAQLVAGRTKPVLEERIIRAIRDRGSDIWNGTTFSLAELRLDSRGRAESMDAYLGSYFDMVCSADYLEYELLDALLQKEDRPFALESLPIRSRTLSPYSTPSACLRAGGGIDAVIAISTLVVYRREGEYWALCDVRSKKVAEYGDLYHVIPSFIFQPVVAPTGHNLEVEWSVKHNIYREYLEELFRVPEAEHAMGAVDPQYFYGHPNLRYLQRLLAAGAADLKGVAFIFNLLNHRPELCTLLLIHDESWYADQRLVREETWNEDLPFSHRRAAAGNLRHLNINEEFMDHEQRSAREHLESVTTLKLDDPEWAKIVRPWLMVPPGAPALILGAREACRRLQINEPDWLSPFTIDRRVE